MRNSKYKEDKVKKCSAAVVKHTLGLHKLHKLLSLTWTKTLGGDRECFLNVRTDGSYVHCTCTYDFLKVTKEPRQMLIWRSPNHFCHSLTWIVLNRVATAVILFLPLHRECTHNTLNADAYISSIEITRSFSGITRNHTASIIHLYSENCFVPRQHNNVIILSCFLLQYTGASEVSDCLLQTFSGHNQK